MGALQFGTGARARARALVAEPLAAGPPIPKVAKQLRDSRLAIHAIIKARNADQ